MWWEPGEADYSGRRGFAGSHFHRGKILFHCYFGGAGDEAQGLVSACISHHHFSKNYPSSRFQNAQVRHSIFGIKSCLHSLKPRKKFKVEGVGVRGL